MCEHLKTANLRGKELLGSVSNGLRAVYNYSGKAKCLDWSTVGPTTFDSRGWNFQVFTLKLYIYIKIKCKACFRNATCKYKKYEVLS